MRRKEDFWQMVAMAAIFARLTPAQAATTADTLVEEWSKRVPGWDEEVRQRMEDR